MRWFSFIFVFGVKLCVARFVGIILLFSVIVFVVDSHEC